MIQHDEKITVPVSRSSGLCIRDRMSTGLFGEELLEQFFGLLKTFLSYYD